MKMVAPITYREIFPNQPDDIEDVLKQTLDRLCRTKTVEYCLWLNHQMKNVSGINIQHQIRYIEDICTKTEKNQLIAVAEANNLIDRTFYNRSQLLMLTKYALEHCRDDCSASPLSTARNRRNFFKAALLVNDLSEIETQSITDGTLSETNKKYKLLQLSRQLLSYSPMNNDYRRALGRGKQFYQEYLPAINSSFQEDFSSQTNITIDHYFACLLLVMMHGYDFRVGIKPLPPFIDIEGWKNQFPKEFLQSANQYFLNESTTIDELVDKFSIETETSLKPFRVTPVLKLVHKG
jgi:hypothetical protein